MGGHLEFYEIADIVRQFPTYSKLRHFVETGTYAGVSACIASKYFERVHTIEIVPMLYWNSRKNAEKENITNIDFYLGDSLKHLPRIMNIIDNCSVGSVYFIDAHQSGEGTGNNGNSVPLLEELELILEHKVKHSVFIFDDIRCWRNHEEQNRLWLKITEDEVLCRFAGFGYTIDFSKEINDRFFVLAYYNDKLNY